MSWRKVGRLWPAGVALVVALAVWWGAARQKQASTPAVDAVAGVKILVEETGFYRVTRAELEQAGVKLESLEPAQAALTFRDEAIPFVTQEDALIFYGQAPTDRYTAQRTYVFRPNQPGQSMSERIVNPSPDAQVGTIRQTLHREENFFYEQRAVDADNPEEVWFWRKLDLAGEQARVELTFETPSLGAGSAELRLRLYGLTHDPQLDGDHDFDVYLNDQLVANVVWDGQVHYTAVLALPDGVLQAGTNRLTLDNSKPGAAFVDQMDIDWFEVDYPAPSSAVNDRLTLGGEAGPIRLDGFSRTPDLFDISQPDQPVHVLLSGDQGNSASLTVTPDMTLTAVGPTGYLRAAQILPLRQTTLRDTQRQADLLIVTTAELAPGLTDLVEARQAQGLTAALVDIAAINDEFGYGEATPEAIQAFVTYAYHSWTRPPRYLFLVGEATTDPRGYLARAPQNSAPLPHNLILSPLTPVEFGGETVSDARLVDVDGDQRPDLAVGRWPVDSLRDVKGLTARTLAYEAGTAAAKAVFTYDGTSAEFADFTRQLLTQAQFPEQSADILAGPSAETVSQRWNAGAWLVSYVGHGSQQLWGKDEVFSVDSVKQLDKSEAPPIVLQFTCLSGQFADPYLQSLSETLLTYPDGPVLLIAATSLTLSTQQAPFAISLLQQLEDPTVQRIGDALQAAKMSLDTTNPGLQEISDTFGLLGDPGALVIRPNPTDRSTSSQ